jgi:hypothetical protein
MDGWLKAGHDELRDGHCLPDPHTSQIPLDSLRFRENDQ